MAHRRQEGQALVGVLVVMTLVFAFAGALAVAASSLMQAQNSAFRPYTNDIAVRNTVAAAIAQADTAGGCQPLPAFAALFQQFGRPACQLVPSIGTNPPGMIVFGGPNTPTTRCRTSQGNSYCVAVHLAGPLVDGSAFWFTTRGRTVEWPDDDSKCDSGAPGFPAQGTPNVTQFQFQVTSQQIQNQPWVCFASILPLPVGLRYDDGSDQASGQILNLAIPVGPGGAIEEVDWESGAGSAGQRALLWEEAL